jgi:hypothetical protein
MTAESEEFGKLFAAVENAKRTNVTNIVQCFHTLIDSLVVDSDIFLYVDAVYFRNKTIRSLDVNQLLHHSDHADHTDQ